MAMDANVEMVSLLKSLTERFDSLQKEVETLKEKEARRSTSPSDHAEAESSETDGATAPEDEHSESARRGRRTPRKASKEHSRHLHPLKDGQCPRAGCSDRSDHRQRSRSSSSSNVDSSWSRLRSPCRGHRSRKGKSPARPAPSAATRGQCRSWADRMSDSEDEQMDYTKVHTFSHSEAEDQPPSKLMEVSEKTKRFLHEKCTRRGRT